MAPWHHGVLIPNKNPSNSPQGDLGSREVAQLQSLGFLDSKSRDVLGKFWLLFEGIPTRERHTTGTRSSSKPNHGHFGTYLKSSFACVWCRRPVRAFGHFQSPKMKARYDLLIHFDHGGLFDVVSILLII